MDPLKGFRARAFIQNADQIDDGVRSGHGVPHRPGIGDVAIDGHHLADVAQRLQVVRQIGVAYGHPNPQAAPRQGAYHLGPDKAGSPEHSDQTRTGRHHQPCSLKGPDGGPLALGG